MITSEIITYWVKTTGADGSVSSAPYMVEMTLGDSWTDVTAQEAAAIAGTPNVVVLRVRCSPATLARMEVDPKIFVLWSVVDG